MRNVVFKYLCLPLILIGCLCLLSDISPAKTKDTGNKIEILTLTDDILLPAFESYEKALEYEDRGDGAFRKRPGDAQKLYEHAEDYLRTAIFKYDELGIEHDLDTEYEQNICDKLLRKIHVKNNKARKKTHKR